MRILIATAVYYPQINGVAVFSRNLAAGLVQRGHEVMVICPSQTGKNHTVIQDGVKVCYLRSIDTKVYPDQIHDVPAKKKIGKLNVPRLMYRHGFRVSVFPQIEIRRAMNEFRPDVVHVQVSDPIGLSVVGYARKYNIPVVTTEHNQPEVLTDPLRVPGFMKKPANFLLSSYFRNRQSKSDFVTMPTEQAIRNLLAKKEFGVPVAAVSNGVDLRCFKPGKAKKEIYEKYKLPEDRPIVLYVGRVDPEKKVGNVLVAFRQMCEKNSQKMNDLKPLFLVIGDGVDRLRLEKETKKWKMVEDVRFLGKVLPPDLYELYKVGWVFATASEIETQGIVLIEAAACGLPLIAVDKGAVAEVCVNGENGFLCPAGDTEAIATAMTKIVGKKDMRERMARRSIEIASGHDFEKTLDKFINIYKKVISEEAKK